MPRPRTVSFTEGAPPQRTADVPAPACFPEAGMDEIKKRTAAEDRPVSSRVRRAVEHELSRPV